MARRALKPDEKVSKRFDNLKDIINPDLAIYICCAYADVPYDETIEAGSWEEYITILDSAPELGFDLGNTDVNSALKKSLSQRERWFIEWGEGDTENPYTDKDYKQLDELFKTMTAQLDDLGALTKQQEDTGRTCAVWALQRAKLSAKGDKESIDIAAKLDKLIRDNLADCNMRSKDILPTQAQRPDGFVDALKKKYGVGADLTQEEFCEIFFKWCKSRKHPQTMDAEEYAILYILKNMAQNDDLPIPMELADDFSLQDFSTEFAKKPNESEKEAYDYLGLVRNSRGGKK